MNERLHSLEILDALITLDYPFESWRLAGGWGYGGGRAHVLVAVLRGGGVHANVSNARPVVARSSGRTNHPACTYHTARSERGNQVNNTIDCVSFISVFFSSSPRAAHGNASRRPTSETLRATST